MFRVDSNCFCRFFEFLVFGVRFVVEGSHYGKEGYLYIQLFKGFDFRCVMILIKVIVCYSWKWFFVWQSYFVCVELFENMNIYDVYFVDFWFSIVFKWNVFKIIGFSDKKVEIDLIVEVLLEKYYILILNMLECKVRLFLRN